MICSDYGVGMALFYDFPVVYASGLGGEIDTDLEYFS